MKCVVFFLWITVVVGSSLDCDEKAVENAKKCMLSNNQKYLNLKKASRFSEMQHLEHLNATCHLNADCFENLEDCDPMGSMSKRSNCASIEFLMKPNVRQCLEKMKNLKQKTTCISNIIAAFSKGSRDKKVLCSVYKDRCADNWIMENCEQADDLISEWEKTPYFAKVVKKC